MTISRLPGSILHAIGLSLVFSGAAVRSTANVPHTAIDDLKGVARLLAASRVARSAATTVTRYVALRGITRTQRRLDAGRFVWLP